MSELVEIIKDPQTGEAISSGVEEKQRARKLFDQAKESLITLAFWIKQIADEKAWLHLGYENFEQAIYEELGYNKSTTSLYRTIATVTEKLISKDEKVYHDKLLFENGLNNLEKGDSSDEMRNFLYLLRDIGVYRSYLLAKGIEDESVDGLSLYKGLPSKTITGEEVTQESIREANRDQLKKWLTAPQKEKEEKEPAIPNPVKDFKDRTSRFSSQFSDLVARFFKEEITENTFDQCADELQQLHNELKEASRDILSFDRYNIVSEEEPASSLKDADFLPINDIAEVLDISDRAVLKWIETEKINSAYLKSKGKGKRLVWRIHPEGLQTKHKNQYYAELNRRAQKDEASKIALRKKERQLILNSLTPKQRKKAQNIEFCIDNYGHLKGEEMELALKQHNESHPDQKPITVKSFYRYLKKYKKHGLKGIADTRGQHRYGETKVNDSDYEYFRDAFLTENKKSHTQCWEETLGKAKKEGRITLEKGKPHEIDTETGEILGTFPSESTFRRQLDRRIPEATQVEMREGKHRFKQTIHFNHINITRETIKPGEIYVMDHHTFDVLCQPSDKKIVTDLLNKILYHNLSNADKTKTEERLKHILKSGLSPKKHVRLWLTNCMDFRTNKQLSWYLHEDAPNSDHVMMTFKWACEEHGYPDVLMMDNGKDFLALDFAGNPYRRDQVYDEVKIHNLLSYLPTEAHFVKPRESQAKPIERQYRNIIDKYARQWPSYTGKNPAERPEKTTELMNKGKLPLAIDVIEKFDDFVINTLNRKKQSGKALNGKSPDQVWNELHPGKRMPTRAALELMTTRNSKPRQIYGNGFKMPLMGGHFYWADWMQGLSSTKEKYYAKWDPYQWEKIFVFRLSDQKPMGWAYLEKMTSAWSQNDNQRKELTEAIQKKTAAVKRRKVTAREVRKIAAGEALENLAAYVEHENEVYEAVNELRENGNKPIKLVQTGLDDLARKMDNSYEKNYNEKANSDLGDITPEKPVKKNLKSIWDD